MSWQSYVDDQVDFCLVKPSRDCYICTICTVYTIYVTKYITNVCVLY